MYHKHHTRGVVLGSKNESDDSRRILLFTENFGLISARVQGARTTQSKLRFSSQDFSYGEFSLVHGKTGWKVVSARATKNFFEILKSSPNKLAIVGNVLNLLKKLAPEEEFSLSLFSIISNFLAFSENAKEEDMLLAECLILLRILHSLGYMRHDPDFSIPLSSSEIGVSDLETIAPKRMRMISLINESLRATQL